MDWRVVGVGGLLGVVLFGVASVQVLDSIWPRTPALERSAAEVSAAWAALEARGPYEVEPEPASAELVAVMASVGAVSDEESVPIEVSAELARVLDDGASVPYYGCTGLPLDNDRSGHVPLFDWLPAAEGLVAIGRADLAHRISLQLRTGQDLLPYTTGLAVYLVTREDEPALVAPVPAASGLLATVTLNARCSDAVLGTFGWDDAEDFFGQGQVPPRWWYDPVADRNALRDYHLQLIAAIEPHQADPEAMSRALAAFERATHPAERALVSRILTTGYVSRLRDLISQLEEARDAG